MNDRNQELIVDLLAGHLSPNEEHATLARIERDPDLRAEYEAQVSTISFLGATSPPMMTTGERASLHASLRRQLHLDDSPVPVVVAPSRWQRWWAPIGGLAVAAAVVVGAVVVLPGALSDNSSATSFEMASAEITTTAPSASVTEDVAGALEDEGAGGDRAGTAAPDATDTAPNEESSADAETQAVDTDEAAIPPPPLPYLTDVDLDVLESELASNPEFLWSDDPPPSSKVTELGADQVDICLESLRVDDPSSEIFLIALTTYQDTESIVVSVTPSAGDGFLAVYSVTLCQELASTRG